MPLCSVRRRAIREDGECDGVICRAKELLEKKKAADEEKKRKEELAKEVRL